MTCDDPGTPHGPHTVDRGAFGVRRCPGVSAPTPPERVCRRCGARDNLKMLVNPLGLVYKSWECRGGCPAIHHPDQPDRIDEDSSDLPDVARAARRVRAWICEWGDGLIQVTNKRPLYARDLEALVRAVQNGQSTVTAAGLIDKFAAEAEMMRDHAVTLNAVAWKMAVALGDVPEGAERVEGNPVELAERLIAERDAARAEGDRLRPVVDAARKVAFPGGVDQMNALLSAVYALGPDAPVLPERVGRAGEPLPPMPEPAYPPGATPLEPACPGDPHCRFGHRCAFHRGEHLAQWEGDALDGGDPR